MRTSQAQLLLNGKHTRIARLKQKASISVLLTFLLVMFSMASTAQVQPKPTNPEDVASAESLVETYFEVLNGPPGERQWARFRALFRPEARIDVVQYAPEGQTQHLSSSLEDYLENVKPFLAKHGYHQEEIKRTRSDYGNMAQFYSSYATTYFFPEQDTLLQELGMIGFQLLKDESRWWIMHVLWNTEGPGVALSDGFAPKAEQLETMKAAISKGKRADEYPVTHLFEKTEVDALPTFPGGPQAMVNYLHQAVQRDYKGTEVPATGRFSFVIEIDGLVTAVEIKDIKDPALRKVLRQAFERMPAWEPGLKDYISVRTQMRLILPLKPKE